MRGGFVALDFETTGLSARGGDRIIELANLGRAVYFITDRKKKEVQRIPAAFVQNYQARMLVQQVWAGYYFEKRV